MCVAQSGVEWSSSGGNLGDCSMSAGAGPAARTRSVSLPYPLAALVQ